MILSPCTFPVLLFITPLSSNIFSSLAKMSDFYVVWFVLYMCLQYLILYDLTDFFNNSRQVLQLQETLPPPSSLCFMLFLCAPLASVHPSVVTFTILSCIYMVYVSAFSLDRFLKKIYSVTLSLAVLEKHLKHL